MFMYKVQNRSWNHWNTEDSKLCPENPVIRQTKCTFNHTMLNGFVHQRSTMVLLDFWIFGNTAFGSRIRTAFAVQRNCKQNMIYLFLSNVKKSTDIPILRLPVYTTPVACGFCRARPPKKEKTKTKTYTGRHSSRTRSERRSVSALAFCQTVAGARYYRRPKIVFVRARARWFRLRHWPSPRCTCSSLVRVTCKSHSY